jgi:hypothetical protein
MGGEAGTINCSARASFSPEPAVEETKHNGRIKGVECRRARSPTTISTRLNAHGVYKKESLCQLMRTEDSKFSSLFITST